MRELYATRFICDGCGATASQMANVDGTFAKAPPGWYDRANWMKGLGGIQLQLFDGRVIGDLCPSCLQLPMDRLLEAVNEQYERLAKRP